MIRHDPSYAPAHNNLAQVLSELGDPQAAAHHANIAATLGGIHSEIYQATIDAIDAGEREN